MTTARSAIKTPRRFQMIMRRTTPVEPSEPVEPAEPLSNGIKGQHAQGANPEPCTLHSIFPLYATIELLQELSHRKKDFL